MPKPDPVFVDTIPLTQEDVTALLEYADTSEILTYPLNMRFVFAHALRRAQAATDSSLFSASAKFGPDINWD